MKRDTVSIKAAGYLDDAVITVDLPARLFGLIPATSTGDGR